MNDFDGDGQLDLLLAHGESARQPISVFKVTQVCMCVVCQWSKKYSDPVLLLQLIEVELRQVEVWLPSEVHKKNLRFTR